MAVVGNCQLNFIPSLSKTKTDGAVILQSVDSIDDEIRDDLKDLSLVDVGHDAFREIFDEMDFLFLNGSLMDAECSFRQSD